jgi:hypothetical protein
MMIKSDKQSGKTMAKSRRHPGLRDVVAAHPAAARQARLFFTKASNCNNDISHIFS